MLPSCAFARGAAAINSAATTIAANAPVLSHVLAHCFMLASPFACKPPSQLISCTGEPPPDILGRTSGCALLSSHPRRIPTLTRNHAPYDRATLARRGRKCAAFSLECGGQTPLLRCKVSLGCVRAPKPYVS